ncbi:carboxymuconolactone decarboxylase family protein [Bradyrhizobium liaoningense]
MNRSDRFRTGMATRRAVLGAEYVDEAWARAQDRAQDVAFQEYLTEAEWGSLWARPGLDRNTRSVVAIACLIATNRPAQLKVHLESALLRNGCSPQLIKEVALQTAAYCGTPAAMDAIAAINAVLQEIDELGGETDQTVRRAASNPKPSKLSPPDADPENETDSLPPTSRDAKETGRIESRSNGQVNQKAALRKARGRTRK